VSSKKDCFQLVANRRIHELLRPSVSDAEHLLREHASVTLLAHIARGLTQKKWQEHLAWMKKRCRDKPYYLLRERQRKDHDASSARKAIASRFYQLRMGKAVIGPHLAEAGKAADDKCWWSGSGASETRDQRFKRCSRWRISRGAQLVRVRQKQDGPKHRYGAAVPGRQMYNCYFRVT
jgi:hypothetical protein